MNQTLTFHVHGMHCQACVVLTESELLELPNVTSAKANLNKKIITVSGNFNEQAPEQIAARLTEVLEPHGYTLSLAKENHITAFIIAFIALQKLGIVNLISGGSVTYGTAFVIGFVASLSTCMAVVGGLVLSMSANYAKKGDQVIPQTLFHLSRLVSFFILGGIIGAIGSAFQLGIMGTFIMSMIVAIVMAILAINLLDIFPQTKRLQLTLPTRIGKKMIAVKKINHTATPLLLGAATFFLPCGFTQSMQIYTLTTGSFLTGGLTMLTFALGTLPVLALISFTSLGIKNKLASGIFFKTAGLVVLFFAVFNFINGLTAIGIIEPLFSL
jgi:sulfite exporter TauE/SafE/copper chaperone CopZ